MAKQIYMPDSPEAVRIWQGLNNTAYVSGTDPLARGLDYASLANSKNWWAHTNGHNDPEATPYWIIYALATDAELLQNPLNCAYNLGVVWFKTADAIHTGFTDYSNYLFYEKYYRDSDDQPVEYIGMMNWHQLTQSDTSTYPEGWSWWPSNLQQVWTGLGNANYRGNDQQNFILLDASIPFTFEEESWEPVGPQPLIDERYATKVPNVYDILIGARTTTTSEEVTVGIPGAEASYYKTRAYNITAHWTSPVDSFVFNVQFNQLTKHSVNASLDGPGPVYSFNFSTSAEIGNICQSVRSPLGRYSGEDVPPSAYADMTETATMTEVPLTWLKEQANMQKSGVVNDDLFTTIYIDFIDSVTSEIVETKELDYSSLFGEDIDLSGGTVPSPNDDESLPNNNRYTNDIGLTHPTLTATGVFNRCYVLDANGVNDLCDFLYNANDSIWEEIIDGVLTRGNPIESLIDLRLYPFDVRQFTNAGTSERIKFGRTETTIVGIKLPHTANAIIDMGECTFNREYNNFLDYHMKAELYIPFCGVCELPIERILNKKLSVKMIVDYVTGACTAVVYADKLPILYRQGVMGISIPMTATNSAEFGKSILGNLVKTGSAIATGAVAGASAMESGDVSGAVSGATNVAGGVLDFANTLYNGSHAQQVGSSSPQCSLFEPKQCYLMISIPTPMNGVYENSYADLVGYATFMPVSAISWMNNTGFTVFDNVKMDIAGATDEEKAMILKLLTTGVYM